MEKFLAEIDDTNNFCLVIAEIVVVVNVDKPLVSKNFVCESNQPGLFMVWEGITKCRALFLQDVEGFDRGDNFVELERREQEAAAIMNKKFMVSHHSDRLCICAPCLAQTCAILNANMTTRHPCMRRLMLHLWSWSASKARR